MPKLAGNLSQWRCCKPAQAAQDHGPRVPHNKTTKCINYPIWQLFPAVSSGIEYSPGTTIWQHVQQWGAKAGSSTR